MSARRAVHSAAEQPPEHRLQAVLRAGVQRRAQTRTDGAPDVYPALNPGGLFPGARNAVPRSQLVPTVPGWSPDFGPYRKAPWNQGRALPGGRKPIVEQQLWNVLPDEELTTDSYGNTIQRVKQEGAYALREIKIKGGDGGKVFPGAVIEFSGAAGKERATSVKEVADMPFGSAPGSTILEFKGAAGAEQIRELTMSPKQLAELANVLPAIAPGPVAEMGDKVAGVVRKGVTQYSDFLKAWVGLESPSMDPEYARRYIGAMLSITKVHWDDVTGRVSYRLAPDVAQSWAGQSSVRTVLNHFAAPLIHGASAATSVGTILYYMATSFVSPLSDEEAKDVWQRLMTGDNAVTRMTDGWTGSTDYFTSLEFFPDQAFAADSAAPLVRVLAKTAKGRVHVYLGVVGNNGDIKITFDENASVNAPTSDMKPVRFRNTIPAVKRPSFGGTSASTRAESDVLVRGQANARAAYGATGAPVPTDSDPMEDAMHAVALDALTVILMQHTGALPAQEGLVLACMTV